MARSVRFVALVVVLFALSVSTALAARPMMVDGDGGGTPAISLFWLPAYQSWVGGHLYEYRCLAGSDGYTVYIIRCETSQLT